MSHVLPGMNTLGERCDQHLATCICLQQNAGSRCMLILESNSAWCKKSKIPRGGALLPVFPGKGEVDYKLDLVEHELYPSLS